MRQMEVLDLTGTETPCPFNPGDANLPKISRQVIFLGDRSESKWPPNPGGAQVWILRPGKPRTPASPVFHDTKSSPCRHRPDKTFLTGAVYSVIDISIIEGCHAETKARSPPRRRISNPARAGGRRPPRLRNHAPHRGADRRADAAGSRNPLQFHPGPARRSPDRGTRSSESTRRRGPAFQRALQRTQRPTPSLPPVLQRTKSRPHRGRTSRRHPAHRPRK